MFFGWVTGQKARINVKLHQNYYITEGEEGIPVPENEEAFIQLLQAVPRIIRNRLRGRHQMVLREADDEAAAASDETSEEELEEEEETGNEGDRFDPQLPTQHSVRF